MNNSLVNKGKPKLAVWKFASCDGCQLSLLDCEDELLAIAGAIEIANFPEASRADFQVFRDCQRQAAVAESQFTPTDQSVAGIAFQHDFARDVLADDAQFADPIEQQSGNVVIPHQQEVDRKVLAIPEKLVLALRKPETAVLEYCLRSLGQAARFLNP